MESGKPGKTNHGKIFNFLELTCIFKNISVILMIFYCTEIFPSRNIYSSKE